MKKLLLAAVFLVGLALIFFYSAKLIKPEKIMAQLNATLGQTLGMKSEIGNLSLHVLPYPFLRLNDVKLSTESIEIACPDVKIKPSWRSLLHRHLAIAKITLIAPSITIHSIEPQLTTHQRLNISRLQLIIKNGQVKTESFALTDTIRIKKTTLSNIDAHIKIRNTCVNFTLSGSSPFCDMLSANGRLDLQKNYYQIELRQKGFNLFHLIKSTDDRISFLDKKITMKVTLKGEANNFTLQIANGFPDFNLHGSTTFPLIITNVDKLIIEKHNNYISCAISKLALQSPSLVLNGTISISNFMNSQETIWSLDLNGLDIDLDSVRKFVLSQWHDNEITRQVCDIVRSGRANSVRYMLTGPVSAFNHLDLMKIWAAVDTAAIYIPKIKLGLDEVNGKISILNGNLAGKNLTGAIGDSKGSNCELFLDLTEKNDAFFLDLDLDVDLDRLQTALVHIVDNNNFQKELANFTDLAGRANGHLSLADNLNNIKTTVLIKEAQAQGKYNRLPWPFHIEQTKIDIHPQRFSWNDTTITLGRNKVQASSGEVSWTNDVTLTIDSFIAAVDTDSLLSQGSLVLDQKQPYTLKNFFKTSINSISGGLVITNGKLIGPALVPNQWKFSADITAKDLTWTSPNLPGTIRNRNVSGRITDKKAQFTTDASFFDYPMHLTTNFEHKNLGQWSGSVEFVGVLKEKQLQWLQEQAYLPQWLSLRTPLFLNKVKVTRSLSDLRIAGAIVAGKEEDGLFRLLLDIQNQKKHAKHSVTFTSGNESGTLSFNKWNIQSPKNLLSWQGTISSPIIDHFFKEQPFIDGSLKGVLSVINFDMENETPTFTGFLEGTNIEWHQDQESPIPFSSANFRVSGDDRTIKINSGHIFDGKEQVNVTGSIIAKPSGLTLNLDLNTEYLSNQNLSHSLTKLSSTFPRKKQQQNNLSHLQQYLSEKISGTTTFRIGAFHYHTNQSSPCTAKDTSLCNSGNITKNITIHDLNETKKSPEQEPQERQDKSKDYVWSPLEGEVEFNSDGKVAIDFSLARLCNIDITGYHFFGPQEKHGSYKISQAQNLDFKNTLPCLGIEQSIIEGKFSLAGTIDQDSSGDWQDGSFILQSSGGVIRKMAVLSKIFSVINFTELLTFRELPDFESTGLPFKDLRVEGNVKNNKLFITKATLQGKGLNLTGQGEINFEDFSSKFTMFIAPFKMIDSVLRNIPLFGEFIGGPKSAILTIPVKVEGHLSDPNVTVLAPSAISKATLQFLGETMTFPFFLFSPFLPEQEGAK